MNTKISSILIALLLMLSSCGDWLNTLPKTDIDENDLFTNEKGFEEALVGVYLIMTKNENYGRQMSWLEINYLAQQYKVTANDKNLYLGLTNYDYSERLVEGFFETVWLNMYNAIANANNIIDHMERTNVSFTGTNKERIYAEALGLRAAIHFDLLRLFHPAYADNPSYEGMPYKTKFGLEITEPMSTDEILEYLLDDLHQAFELFSQVDDFRTTRMNQYAVAGLLARVYLYMGEHQEAYKWANVVISEGPFRFIAESEVAGSDVQFSDYEVLLGLNKVNLVQTTSPYFFLGSDRQHTIANWPEISGGDLRVNWFTDIESPDKFPVKFTIDYIPLMRVGEMHLIAAEALSYSDMDGAQKILDNIRESRLATAVSGDFYAQLKAEYERELIVEGQLFYYYKRTMQPNLINAESGASIVMNTEKYTVPIPMIEEF